MAGELQVEEARSLADVLPHVPAWEDLVSRALEENVYLEPDFLVECLRRFGAPYRVAFVYESGPGGRLLAVAPFTLLPPTRRAPFPRLSTYVSFHVYLAYPLLDRERAADALVALWDWLERPGRDFGLLLLEQIPALSPTWALLRAELVRRRRAYWIKGRFHQATLRRPESFDAFLASLSHDARRDYRRLARRLAEQGRVEVRLHRDLRQAPDLARRYMDLEMKTWKAERGVALAQREADASFFTEVTRKFGERGRLFFTEIALDDRPIAMCTGFTAGRRAFAHRTVFDPAFARFSPGVRVMIEKARFLAESPDLEAIEAGNDAPDSFVNRLWRELAEMQVVTIATPSPASRAYVLLGPYAFRAWKRLATPARP